jgi:hypothetical protein
LIGGVVAVVVGCEVVSCAGRVGVAEPKVRGFGFEPEVVGLPAWFAVC